jgi:hypothetical protein
MTLGRKSIFDEHEMMKIYRKMEQYYKLERG